MEVKKSSTFAPVKVKTKQKIASRVLLAVLLPMLLLSSLHIHPQQPSAVSEECTDCVQHHCAGHIVQQVQTLHDCVLCQFQSLPMVVVTGVDVAPVDNVCKLDIAQCRQPLLSQEMGFIVTRGPPAV